jgi:hypothetical protein
MHACPAGASCSGRQPGQAPLCVPAPLQPGRPANRERQPVGWVSWSAAVFLAHMHAWVLIPCPRMCRQLFCSVFGEKCVRLFMYVCAVCAVSCCAACRLCVWRWCGSTRGEGGHFGSGSSSCQRRTGPSALWHSTLRYCTLWRRASSRSVCSRGTCLHSLWRASWVCHPQQAITLVESHAGLLTVGVMRPAH